MREVMEEEEAEAEGVVGVMEEVEVGVEVAEGEEVAGEEAGVVAEGVGVVEAVDEGYVEVVTPVPKHLQLSVPAN